MNLKNARDILKSVRGLISAKHPMDLVDASRANGYLECYEQMKPLVETLEHCRFCRIASADGCMSCSKADDALAQWKERQKLSLDS